MPPRSFAAPGIFLYGAFLFFILLTWFSRTIPFFWDEYYYASAGHVIFDSGFSRIIPDEQADRGNFPLYGFYLAIWWKLFGKTLLISHLAVLPLLLAITWEFFSLSRKFISDKLIPFALLLLLLEPTFITQSVLMGHDLFMVYFFLLSGNALLEARRARFACAISLLALHNIKGIPAAVSLILFYLLYMRLIRKEKLKAGDRAILSLPAILWLAWMCVHHLVTGRYFFHPLNPHETRINLNLFGLKRILLGIWQIVDFGRVFIWMFIAGSLFIFRKTMTDSFKPLWLLLLTSLSVFLVFFAVLDVELCHRYYMPVFLLSAIASCFFLERIRRKPWRYCAGALLSAGLLTGNFWLYGGNFSNGWDSSLKCLPYFTLRNEMIGYVKEKQIDPSEIGTKFPLYQNLKYADLFSEDYCFEKIDSSFSHYRYILLSDISNEFTAEEKEMLRSGWALVHEIRKGQVYLQLYKNPLRN